MKIFARIALCVLALLASFAHAADQFIQTSEASGTTTAVATLNGVATGSTIVAFLFDGSGSSAPATQTVADGQGSYTGGASATDTSNQVWGRVFTIENTTSGTHTITGTVTTGNSCYLRVVEVTGSGAGSVTGTAAQEQNTPGTGANAISSTNATVAGVATLVGFSTDSSDSTPANAPNVGTGFTSRATNGNGVIGAFRLETVSAAATAAATFTAPTGSHNFVTLAAAVTNGVGGGGGTGIILKRRKH